MFTIKIEDGREAPWKPSKHKFYPLHLINLMYIYLYMHVNLITELNISIKPISSHTATTTNQNKKQSSNKLR